jgi:3-oxoacyl-[acyl-carrier protein] reductase
MNKLLKGKIAFITGASGDIGLAITKEFIKNGAKVIISYRKKNPEMKKFCKLNPSKIIQTLKFDLENLEQMKKQVKKILDKKINIDILVNSAGIASGSIFEMTSLAQMKKMFEVNFFSQIVLTQLIVKLMKKSPNASICNIGSISGIVPYRGNLSYGSSKAALMFATKILSKELLVYKIRVNSIAPSVVTSKMADRMDKKVREKMINNSSIKRECKPEEVAKFVSKISSDKSIKINGRIFKIDGDTK